VSTQELRKPVLVAGKKETGMEGAEENREYQVGLWHLSRSWFSAISEAGLHSCL
jgi:hypothetical protein